MRSFAIIKRRVPKNMIKDPTVSVDQRFCFQLRRQYGAVASQALPQLSQEAVIPR